MLDFMIINFIIFFIGSLNGNKNLINVRKIAQSFVQFEMKMFQEPHLNADKSSKAGASKSLLKLDSDR